MEPTLDVGQRVLVNRFLYHFNDPTIGDIVVFHPPAGADSGTECGEPHPPDQACPTRRPRTLGPELHQADRRRPGRHALSVKDGHPVVNGVEKTDEPYTIPCGNRRSLQFAEDDHDSARPLLHDGRQPWGERRQPILGTRPPQTGSSARPSPPTGRPTASGSSKPRQPDAPGWRARAGCSPSTAASAAASSPAPTRPGAAAWPGRWSPPRS